MKKVFRFLLPILIIAVIVAAVYLFFFRIKPDLTAGLFADLAESKLEDENYDAATRYYRWAVDLCPEDTDLRFQLAEAYRRSGNYSKTENVLAHAIYDHPEEVRLYTALCKVYVEQDKLLDAQLLLDKISNPEVMAELSQRRPAAPVISPEGDSYNTYISVSLSQNEEGVTCYYTVDGQFPSLEGNVYTGPFDLNGGQTTVCAVAVNEEGLVSPAVYEGYTIVGVIEDVEFHDGALKQTVQELLNRGDRTLQTDDLWGIEELTLPQELSSTADLHYITGLTKLSGFNLGELDYSFLSQLHSLRYLELDGCVLTTEALSWIGKCPSLEVLILSNCGLSNIAPLENLSGLRVLDLSGNSISSIIPISNIASLDELYLGHNAIVNLPSLKPMRSLRLLDLSYNVLDSVGQLSGCTSLERVNVSHNKLVSVLAIGTLENLVYFNASNNNVRDVSALSGCKSLETFIMTDNKLTKVDFLGSISSLVEVNVDYNDIVTLPQMAEDCKLQTFSGAHNFLEDVDGLAGLQNLNLVNADYNNIRDISSLVDCPVLAQVNVYGTNVHSGGELAEKGVVVNYTPTFG